MRHETIIVRAVWDGDAAVRLATSEDVPGLIAEAGTPEALKDIVLVRIGELLELNGTTSSLPAIPVHIFAEQSSRIANPATRR